MGVDVKYQNKGIGSEIMKKIIIPEAREYFNFLNLVKGLFIIPLNDKDTFVEKVYELMNKNEKYENYRKLSLVRANDFSMESNKAKLKELIENTNF